MMAVIKIDYEQFMESISLLYATVYVQNYRIPLSPKKKFAHLTPTYIRKVKKEISDFVREFKSRGDSVEEIKIANESYGAFIQKPGKTIFVLSHIQFDDPKNKYVLHFNVMSDDKSCTKIMEYLGNRLRKEEKKN
jgi:hypothetical protein